MGEVHTGFIIMFTQFVRRRWGVILGLGLSVPMMTFANEAAAGHTSATSFLWIAVILLAAMLSRLVEFLKQPAVLGELTAGVILGNLGLIGFHALDAVRADAAVQFLAELGVVILLFQIGLESNVAKMRAVGRSALLVATVGVVLPFVFGAYVVGPWLMPGLSQNAYLFLGAALTATSVGITARVFRDLRQLQAPEAQIVLGAAVIDDVMGLIILAIVSAIVTVGAVSLGTVGLITAKAILFLIGSIVLGQLLAPKLSRAFALISTGVGMKFTMAIAFGLAFAYLAALIGLAPIVGAFAAGLILDPVHFNYFKDPRIVRDLREVSEGADTGMQQKLQALIDTHARRHLEDIVQPVGYFLVPIFFVVTGMNVRLETLFDLRLLAVALGITVVAFIGKLAAGLVAGNVSKLVVGVGMVPRGEVGLIFANIGKSLGVVSDEAFSVIVIMVILTTLLTPPILAYLLRRSATSVPKLVAAPQ